MRQYYLLLAFVFTAVAAQSTFGQSQVNDWNMVMNSGTVSDKPKYTFKIYRTIIKPQLPSSCNFELECSSFGPAMIRRFGFPKGYFLTIDRWIRDSKISVYETYPIRLSAQRKIKETPKDFDFGKVGRE